MSSRPDSIVGRIFITDYLGRTIAKTTAPKTENTDGDIISRIADPSDDLQSGGLTEEQLGQTTYPGSFSDPLQPSVAELRRLAIYNNYRALIDTSADGGYGFLFGPSRNGSVLGREYVALARTQDDRVSVSLMVQIPDNFDATCPFIITAPSSGSRGIYGGISIAEWAFADRCAVAYTDKATGPAFHDLTSDTAYDVEGRRIVTPGASGESLFHIPPSPDLVAFKDALPDRLGMKHAHSAARTNTSQPRSLSNTTMRGLCFISCASMKLRTTVLPEPDGPQMNVLPRSPTWKLK